MSNIEFSELVESEISNLGSVREWVNQVVILEGFEVGVLSFVFMSDEELLNYNRKFLDHDFYTDVITFDDSELPVINGDILVSIDRVKENSKDLIINYKEEILRVIIHGVLHLCGYKDKKDKDILVMREKENLYLSLVDFVI